MHPYHTFDGAEIRLTIWHGESTIIYDGFYLSQVVVRDFWTINSRERMSVSPTIRKWLFPLQLRLPGLLLHVWWWSQATGSYHTGGVGRDHCQCKVLKKCRKTKRLKSKSDKTTSISSKLTYPTRFFLLETNKRRFCFRVFLGMKNLML